VTFITFRSTNIRRRYRAGLARYRAQAPSAWQAGGMAAINALSPKALLQHDGRTQEGETHATHSRTA